MAQATLFIMRCIVYSFIHHVIADQRATQKLLKAAPTIVQEFYGMAALLQRHPAGPLPLPAL